MKITDEHGGCSIPVIAANLIGWAGVETEDGPEE
jgi:hypothetical protein